MGVGLQGPK